MNISFNINVQVHLDHVAATAEKPEHDIIKVTLGELQLSTSGPGGIAVQTVVMLGAVGDMTPENFEVFQKEIKLAAHNAVLGSLRGIAYRVQHPGMAAMIDKMREQWTPVGVPKEFFSGPLGEPYEPQICSVCGLPQTETTGGPCCANGHGGAPSKEIT